MFIRSLTLAVGVIVAAVMLVTVGGNSQVSATSHTNPGGPVIISNVAADRNGGCDASCQDLHQRALKSVMDNSTREAPLGQPSVLWISGPTAAETTGLWGPGSYLSWIYNETDAKSKRTNIVGYNSDFPSVTGALEYITDVDFNDYEAILIGSYLGRSEIGFFVAPLMMEILENRSEDLADFVSGGGGLMALLETDESTRTGNPNPEVPEAWSWLPEQLEWTDLGHLGGKTHPTPAFQELIPDVTKDDVNSQTYSVVFTGPQGFSGLDVLAFHDHNCGQGDNQTPCNFQYDEGEHVTMLGGSNVVFGGGAPAPTPTLDAEPPVVTVPADMTIFATSVSGAVATFSASATDNVGVASGPVCDPASGSLFPVGATSVTCTAIDTSGNPGAASFDVTVLGGRSLIQEAADEIFNISGDQKEFSRALKHLDKALSDDRWTDDLHPDSKHGKKVFDEVRGAIKDLEKLLRASDKKGKKGKHDEPLTEAQIAVIELAIERLVIASQILAATAIADAEAGTTLDPDRQPKVDKEIAKANKHFTDAMSTTDPDDAVNDLKRARDHALHAIKHQNK